MARAQSEKRGRMSGFRKKVGRVHWRREGRRRVVLVVEVVELIWAEIVLGEASDWMEGKDAVRVEMAWTRRRTGRR